jgi:hypothetical protein
MGRNQLGFAIASIRRHLTFKETSKQKNFPAEKGGFSLHRLGQMAIGSHEKPYQV